jgi:hypothetical protein
MSRVRWRGTGNQAEVDKNQQDRMEEILSWELSDFKPENVLQLFSFQTHKGDESTLILARIRKKKTSEIDLRTWEYHLPLYNAFFLYSVNYVKNLAKSSPRVFAPLVD